MSDPFHSPKGRLARANEHIDEIARQGKAFFETEPYTTTIEIEPKTGNQLYKFKMTRPLPDNITHLTVECLEALRSALDQAAFTTSALSGKPTAKSAYFPIADDVAGLENVIKGRCKDLPPDIITFFRALNPYKGGNYPVWALNKLCNTNKHKLIAPVGLFPRQIRLSKAVMTGEGYFPNFAWDIEKNELVFAVIPPGGNLQYDFNLTHSITFWDVEAVSGEEVGPVLEHIARVVERIVLGTEAEAARLGLIK